MIQMKRTADFGQKPAQVGRRWCARPTEPHLVMTRLPMATAHS
jgi:hypothetical protein